jgi:hypothetical protein
MGSKRTTWIGGAVVVCLVLVVGTWFLAITPKLGAIQDTAAQTETTEQQNQVLEIQTEALAADFAKLKDYRKELAGIQAQIPSTAQMSAYLRELDAIAAQAAVTVVQVQPQTPLLVTVAPSASGTDSSSTSSSTGVSTEVQATPTAEPTPAPTETTGTDGSGTGTGSGTESGVVAPTGFTAIPMTIVVLGTWDATQTFIDLLQNSTTRLFLANTVAGISQQETEPSQGRPATALGDQELTITGFLWALPSAVDGTADGESDDEPSTTPTPQPPLPGAVPGKNPLLPVQGEKVETSSQP